MTQPVVSIVMPVYNTERYIAQAIRSVLDQTFRDFELIVVDDAGTDRAIDICRSFDDARIRIVHQENRGLAGARNTGIRHSRGEFIALLDSDDAFAPDKLAKHVKHLRDNPHIGISYAGSLLIDDDGNDINVKQTPKIENIKPQDVFLRNPIGNGSVPVIRKEVFKEIAFPGRPGEDDYFDESFRQSEDIECWTRIILTTNWKLEGLAGHLTLYRINAGGLSAHVFKQLNSWFRVRDKIRSYAPGFADRWEAAAEGYQKRYLARRCVRMNDAAAGHQLLRGALQRHPGMIFEEPVKTVTTIAAVAMLKWMPASINRRVHTMVFGSAT